MEFVCITVCIIAFLITLAIISIFSDKYTYELEKERLKYKTEKSIPPVWYSREYYPGDKNVTQLQKEPNNN